MDAGRSKSLLLPLGGALLLSGVAGAIYYYLTKKDEDEIKLVNTMVNQWSITKVQVPLNVVGLVIGRQGSNIKLIQERTNTKISFSDEEVDGHRTCIIKGSEENIALAQKLVIKAVNDQPVIEAVEMLVPIAAVGRIIGRNGDVIRSISRASGSKIIVERDEDRIASLSYPENMRKIILKGGKEQIEAARSLLLEKSSSISLGPSQEALTLANSDRFIEAYVSAVDSASHFWLQVVGPRSVQLDKLVTEMTEYYECEENRELHKLDKVNIDSIVAAKFPHDNSWYRGMICSYEPNETDPIESLVTVYYLDFGDTETVKIDTVYELRTDFLKLNFQAIECCLANVKPESVKGDEAADAFEELTYAAQWKVVMVKVVGYQQEGDKTIPCVQIIDTNGPTDIDVAEELAKRGLVEFSNGVTRLSSSP
ncbi:tudor and KH domain-containing protein homolog isoform X2 [Procambarus clarkii]|uniref:tudor and KH domain-containing protein homolog isoform X2 n=1 Tax=Procambarus clarkii TaxID=6728 RepID=UPI001E67266B|nr:tudor and KH domain-containing protein homolog isoform X2 [Procambarus clarkii]